MQTSNRLFDDLARVASGAFNTLSGLREEIETRVRERVERMAADLDLVTREVRRRPDHGRECPRRAGGARRQGRKPGGTARGPGHAARAAGRQARRTPQDG